MYKSIVPGLVSFETKLSHIPGLNFSEQFDFYPAVKTPCKFHYKINIDNHIGIPKVYDFRNGYMIKKESVWYYERNLKLFCLKFSYDEERKTLCFNKIYSYLPFEIGHIYPVGRHIRDLIDLELLLKGFLSIIGGFTIKYKGKNICLLGPSMNGKTTFLKSILMKGGEYVSEGPVIIDLNNKSIYPCSNNERWGRKEGKDLFKLIKNNVRYNGKITIDKYYFIINSTNQSFNSTTKNMFDFIFYRSLFFLKNPWISSYIFKNNLTEKVYKKIVELKKINNLNYEYVHVKNYFFGGIF